jgi:hypothetical protein
MRRKWCSGDGPEGSGMPCGAKHLVEGATPEEDIASHECAGCGRYTPGAQCSAGGLCPACWRKEYPRIPLPVGIKTVGWIELTVRTETGTTPRR